MLRRAFLFAPLLPLSACSGRIDISVTGLGDRPIFHLTLPPPAIISPTVRWLSVHEFERHGSQENLREMWGFSAPRAFSGELHVPYGEVPRRFSEDVAPKPLEPTVTYEVTAVGGSYSGNAWFRIVDGRVT